MSSDDVSVFPTSALMPKDESGVNAFLEEHPNYDGRGVTIAIFDTGCDVNSPGLIRCPDGRPKFVDFVDSTGSGDVDTSVVVTSDLNNCILGLSGRNIQLGNWKNPSGKWHVGLKRGYDLFPSPLVTRLKASRKDVQQRRFSEMEANILAALAASQVPASIESEESAEKKKEEESSADDKNKDDKDKGDAASTLLSTLSPLFSFSSTPTPSSPLPPSSPSLSPSLSPSRTKAELEAELAQLRAQWKAWEDPGPLMDCVVWHDGETWVAIIDTTEKGDLRAETPMAAYKVGFQYRTFTQDSQLNYTFNLYEDGNVLSIVVAAGSHGTHVAGIVAAHYPEDPKRNGQAPGAQLVSVKIGDTNLGTMETNVGMMRGLLAAVESKCDMINMSYGEQTSHPNSGRFTALAQDIVKKHGMIYVSSAGNAGPCLSTVGSPGGNEEYLIGVGAFVTPSMVQPQYSFLSELQREGRNYQWSSRGPSADGSMGVSISALGAAVAPVPNWCLQPTQLMNGTSMSSPAACGGIALLISALKQKKCKYTPFRIKAAVEAAAKRISGDGVDPFALGSGLLNIPATYAWLDKHHDDPELDVHYHYRIGCYGRQEAMRGVYIRENGGHSRVHSYILQLKAEFPEWQFEKDAEMDAFKSGDVNLDGILADDAVVAAPDHPVLSHLRQFSVSQKTHTEIRAKVTCPMSWVQVAEWAVITSQTKTIPFRVDPTHLAPGAHLTRITFTSTDTGAELFTIPVTVLVEEPAPYEADASGNAYVHTFRNVSLPPAGSLSKYFAVPIRASWAHVRVKLLGQSDAPSKGLSIAGLQLVPKVNPDNYDFGKYISLSPGQEENMVVPVYGGVVWELRVTRPWAGVGDVSVDVDVQFHGVTANGSTRDAINLTPADFYANINLNTLTTAEIAPSASLTHCSSIIRPVKSWFAPLGVRDTLPDGRTVCRLTLEYTYDAPRDAAYVPTLVGVHGLLYEAQLDGQMVHIYDANKKFVGASDAFPREIKLKEGTGYTIRVELKHSELPLLEQLKNTALSMRFELEKPISVPVYSSRARAVAGTTGLGITKLFPGKVMAAVLQVPMQDAIPKVCSPGNVLSGKFIPIPATFPLLAGMKKPPFIPLTYTLPPAHHSNAQHCSFPEPTLAEEKKKRDAGLLGSAGGAAEVDVEELVVQAQMAAMKKTDTNKAASMYSKLGRDLLLKYRADIPNDDKDAANGVDLSKNDTKRMELAETILQMLLRATPFRADLVNECADIVLNTLHEQEVLLHFGSGVGEGDDEIQKKKHKRMITARTLFAQCYAARAIAAVLSGSETASTTISQATQWASAVDSMKDHRNALILTRHVLRKEYGQALQKLKDVSVKKTDPLVILVLQAAVQQAQEDAVEAPKVSIHHEDTIGRALACMEVAIFAALGWNEFAQWKMRKLLADYPIAIERFY